MRSRTGPPSGHEDPAGGGYREGEDASCRSVLGGEAPALGLDRAEAPPRFPVRADRLDSEEDGREGQHEEGPYQRERPVGQFREQYRDEQRHRGSERDPEEHRVEGGRTGSPRDLLELPLAHAVHLDDSRDGDDRDASLGWFDPDSCERRIFDSGSHNHRFLLLARTAANSNTVLPPDRRR